MLSAVSTPDSPAARFVRRDGHRPEINIAQSVMTKLVRARYPLNVRQLARALRNAMMGSPRDVISGDPRVEEAIRGRGARRDHDGVDCRRAWSQ